MRSVVASTASAPVMVLKYEPCSELNAGSITRLMLNAAAAASNGSPFWNMTLSRSFTSQVVGSTSTGSDAASPRPSAPPASRVISVSKMLSVTCRSPPSSRSCGSSVVGSDPMAMPIVCADALDQARPVATIAAAPSMVRLIIIMLDPFLQSFRFAGAAALRRRRLRVGYEREECQGNDFLRSQACAALRNRLAIVHASLGQIA